MEICESFVVQRCFLAEIHEYSDCAGAPLAGSWSVGVLLSDGGRLSQEAGVGSCNQRKDT